MLLMPGWKYERTVIVQSDAPFDRKDEFISVNLKLKDWEITDPAREIRVVSKSNWNRWDNLCPSQVSKIEKSGGYVKCQVSFLADVPRQSSMRFGILFGNPNAEANPIKPEFSVSEKDGQTHINQSNYIVSIDNKTGLLSKMLLKYFRVGFLLPYNFNAANVLQGFGRLLLATDKGVKTVDAVSNHRILELEKGELFLRQKSTAEFNCGNQSNLNPICETEMLFVANKPFVHFRQKIIFKADTKITGMRLGNFVFSDKLFTHFSFRPTTPELVNTDIEEIGHVLIDHDLTKDLPQGSLFADLIPLEVPWTSLICTRRNDWYSLSRYLLDYQQKTPDQKNPNYRPGTYLIRNQNQIEWFQAPVYCAKPENINNSVLIKAGSEFETTFALNFAPFEETYWGQQAEQQGKLLNSPLQVSSFPLELENDQWQAPKASSIIGNRKCDYLRAGVR